MLIFIDAFLFLNIAVKYTPQSPRKINLILLKASQNIDAYLFYMWPSGLNKLLDLIAPTINMFSFFYLIFIKFTRFDVYRSKEN